MSANSPATPRIENRGQIRELLSWAEKLFRQTNIPSSRLDSEILLAHVLGVDRTWLITHDDEQIDNLAMEKFKQLVAHRAKREPIAYLIGKKEFYGRTFFVNQHVLIPRPETESIIDVVKYLSIPAGSTVIDVGTGSGIVGLTVGLEIADLKKVIASDISIEALRVAKQNFDSLKPPTATDFIHSNLLYFWDETSHTKPDLIVSNLPYVDRSWQTSPEVKHEPALALYADVGGLELIYRLIKQASSALKKNGFLVLEADPEQHQSIIIFAKEHDFTLVLIEGYAIALQR